jgi:outer membrane protein assembly factor BamD (BamD/ComL family)
MITAPARTALVGLAASALLLLLLSATGCGGKGARAARRPASPSATASAPIAAGSFPLDPGYAALEQRNYNAAIAQADAFLASQPHGEGTAEALYLKGRGFEGKNAAGVSEPEAKANLQAARDAYVEALGMNPRQPLLSYIQASLGNVAYFQDDYPTAIAQLTASLDGLDKPEVKAWALYRIGLSHQRVGQFQQADQAFAAVQQQFPGTEPARRAQEHQGARAFYVQLATFASAAPADRAVADLKKQGVTAASVAGPAGRAVLRAGPVASYSQAQYLRARFLDKYPDALIVP